MASTKFRPGACVRVADLSGVDSGKYGIVVDRREVRTGPRGIPLIPGAYKPVDWQKEVAVRLSDGELITMFKNRLITSECPAYGSVSWKQRSK